MHDRTTDMKRKTPATLIAIFLFSTSLIACSSTPTQESTGEFLDSSLITAKVKTRLIDDRITGGFQISVSTYKGVVMLNGIVNSELEKNTATRIASSVAGVKRVDNKLIIRTD